MWLSLIHERPWVGKINSSKSIAIASCSGRDGIGQERGRADVDGHPLVDFEEDCPLVEEW